MEANNFQGFEPSLGQSTSIFSIFCVSESKDFYFDLQKTNKNNKKQKTPLKTKHT